MKQPKQDGLLGDLDADTVSVPVREAPGSTVFEDDMVWEESALSVVNEMVISRAGDVSNDSWEEQWSLISRQHGWLRDSPKQQPQQPTSFENAHTLSDNLQEEMLSHSGSTKTARGAGHQLSDQANVPALNEENWFGLPEIVRTMQRQNGVTSLYDWQKICLQKIMTGRGLLYRYVSR